MSSTATASVALFADDLDPELAAALETVIDPELAMNVVELGMVRRVDRNGDHLTVHLALTSLTCPVWDLFVEQVEIALEDLCASASVEFAVRPAWSPEQMTPHAREMLVASGYLPPTGTFERLGR